MTLVLVLLIHKAIRPYDCYVPCSFVDTKSHKAIMVHRGMIFIEIIPNLCGCPGPLLGPIYLVIALLRTSAGQTRI